jgi:amidophosphoribosyltransferase
MSDSIKHECGVALLKLNKPLQYYLDKYKTPTYALDKMYLMMEKMRNRGQDGSGIAVVKRDTHFGHDFIYRERSSEPTSLQQIFQRSYAHFESCNEEQRKDAKHLLQHCESFGNVFLGHLRYGTHGVNSEKVCHPFYRKSNWLTRNLVLAGNFNLTNVKELMTQLVNLGQHPRQNTDTVLVLEKIGHFLDLEVQALFDQYKKEGLGNQEISEKTQRELVIENLLTRAVKGFDGGYNIAGVLGYGDAFVFRDPNGIRPCHYYADDEVTIVASERPAIATTFNIDYNQINELPPAYALILKNDQPHKVVKIQEEKERLSCSFERIYFARGTDGAIYGERKMLGKLLAPLVYEKIKADFNNTVFSFIPNTAELAYMGLIKGLEQIYRSNILSSIDKDNTRELVEGRIREEKLIVKDAKLRTFITNDQSRNALVSHVYDITYNSIVPGQDTICIIDDSIVRGTTLKQSIINILGRLKPKKVMVVSSAPQIRYPDCYGIDMSKLGDLLVFRAAKEVLSRRNELGFMEEIYQKCILENQKSFTEIRNILKDFYAVFDNEELTKVAGELVTPEDATYEVELVFQTIENLAIACPNDRGDWYFSGNYATSGGNRVANQSFINYFEDNGERAY